MKTKKIKIILSVISTMVLSYGALYAWNGLTASDGDTLTHTKWNELVTKIDSISSESGKVGIGTDTPTHPLHLESNANTNIIKIHNTNPNGRSSIDYIDDSGSFGMSMGVANSGQSIAGQAYIHAHGTHPLILAHSGGPGITIIPGNNVGVGQSDPKAKLDVDGGIKIAGSTCDTDHVGTIQYDSATDTFKGCRDNGGSPAWTNLH